MPKYEPEYRKGGVVMGEYADAEIDRADFLDARDQLRDAMLDSLFVPYSCDRRKLKPQPKARDLRRLAGELNKLKPKKERKLIP